MAKRMVEIKSRMSEISAITKAYNAEGAFLFQGPIEKQLELRALASEWEELDQELFDLELSVRSALHN